jgi:hypothetical protein
MRACSGRQSDKEKGKKKTSRIGAWNQSVADIEEEEKIGHFSTVSHYNCIRMVTLSFQIPHKRKGKRSITPHTSPHGNHFSYPGVLWDFIPERASFTSITGFRRKKYTNYSIDLNRLMGIREIYGGLAGAEAAHGRGVGRVSKMSTSGRRRRWLFRANMEK